MVSFECSAEFWSVYACYWRLELLNRPEEFEVIVPNAHPGPRTVSAPLGRLEKSQVSQDIW